MTNFKTISELEILRMVHDELITRLFKEYEFISEHPDEERPIAKARAKKYSEQADEIYARLIKLEKEREMQELKEGQLTTIILK